MRESVIKVENLGKKYQLSHQHQDRYIALRDVILENAKRLVLSPSNRQPNQTIEDFWALQGISFDIKQGQVVGIVGHNGAGKSTLLKILSRITEPTEGRVSIKGRIASLLEVGTGFHPELSGRENIYLNGAILGMTRQEIKIKFDEIISFAEVERFLDTPVKKYSSGMYMRLAFAVAVHLEPEILIVDEVLAVGDAEFQKKCFQKMQEIGQSDKTILLVSHNLSAIRNICQQAIVLERGRVAEIGSVNEVVDKYLVKINKQLSNKEIVETQTYIIEDVDIFSGIGQVIKTFDPVKIIIKLTAKCDVIEPDVYVAFQTIDGQIISALVLRDFFAAPRVKKGQSLEVTFNVQSLALLPGNYQLRVHLVDVVACKYEVAPITFPFEVVESAIYGGRKIDSWYGHVGLNAEATAFAY